MQLFVLLLMMGLMAYDATNARALWPLGGIGLALAVLLPQGVLMIVHGYACVATGRTLAHKPTHADRALRRLEIIGLAVRLMVLATYYLGIYAFGWLTWLKEAMGGVLFVPELLTLLPPLVVVVFGWWAYYPIDRRLREALILRQLDSNEPVFPIGTRGAFVLSQVRHQLLLLLAPMLLLLMWVQVVEYVNPPVAYREPMLLVGGLAVFLVAPLMMRSLWDTEPLPKGKLRKRLMRLCRDYQVRVGELLLWRTYGGMINGAVIGALAPLRFILLTDGLVERMRSRNVEAVMAHELGHIKHHHMPWMIAAVLAILSVATIGVETVFAGVEWIGAFDHTELGLIAQRGIEAGGLVVVFGLWAIAFGWVSRRFERQADTFAVRHLSRHYPKPPGVGADDGEMPGRDVDHITAEAVEIFCEALTRVAALSHQPLDRPSWRHGSIAWRIAYLRSLVGQPIHRCAIDRLIRGVNLASALLIALSILWYQMI